MTFSRRLIVVFSLIVGCAATDASLADTQPRMASAELEKLLELSQALGRDGGTEVRPADVAESCPASALRAVILYRNAPDQYEDVLFEALTIDDYAARARNEYNWVSKDAFVAEIAEVDNVYPEITDARVKLAISFCRVRDENIWMRASQAPISLARFLRGALAGAVWRGSELEGGKGLQALNEIDRRTRALHGSP